MSYLYNGVYYIHRSVLIEAIALRTAVKKLSKTVKQKREAKNNENI
tara:strand:+ start:140 stop:277 length:138 start_codon:yes stop_codon:yes gene_type:complete